MTEDDRMGRALDGVTASGNIAAAAIKIRYRAIVLSTSDDLVTMMVPVPDWNDLVEQIDMFVAVANYIAEQEEP
jgi:hypothetical protein